MGKGDRRSKRGKIFRGTYGKKRPKPQEEAQKGQGGCCPVVALAVVNRGALRCQEAKSRGTMFAVAARRGGD